MSDRVKIVRYADKMDQVDLSVLDDTPEVWRQLLAQFPDGLVREIVEEIPTPTQTDIEWLATLELASPYPVEVSTETLLYQEDNKFFVSLLPRKVIDAINLKWHTSLTPVKGVRDPNPKRYLEYASMPSASAKPIVVVGGSVVYGNGRFAAALLRGDPVIKMWKLQTKRRGKSASASRTAAPTTWDGLHMPRAVPYSELLEVFDDLLRIQCSNGNWNWDPYMHGMANGMILMRSLVSGEDPKFLDPPPRGYLGDKPQTTREVVKLSRFITVEEARAAGRKVLSDPKTCAEFKARHPELSKAVRCGTASLQQRYHDGFEAGKREADLLISRYTRTAKQESPVEEAMHLVQMLTLSGGNWPTMKAPSTAALAILAETVREAPVKVYRGVRINYPVLETLTGPKKWIGTPPEIYEAARKLQPGDTAPAWLRKQGNDYASSSKSIQKARAYMKDGSLQVLLSATVDRSDILVDLTNWKRVLTKYNAVDPDENWTYYSREKEVIVLEPIIWTVEEVYERPEYRRFKFASRGPLARRSPRWLYHGTTSDLLPDIESSGFLKAPVYLSPDYERALEFASMVAKDSFGPRRGSPVVFEIELPPELRRELYKDDPHDELARGNFVLHQNIPLQYATRADE